MIRAFYRNVPGWLVICFMAANIFMSAVVMPQAAARMEKASPGGVILDLTIPTYHSEEALLAVENLGDAGRAVYKSIAFGEDLIYPIIYGFTLILLVAYLWRKVAPELTWCWRLCMVPVLAVLFDYAENFSIVAMVNQFPEKVTITAQLASAFTLFKWFFVFASILLVLAGLGAWIIRRLTE